MRCIFCRIAISSSYIADTINVLPIIYLGSNNEGAKSNKDLIIAISSAVVNLLLVILIIGGFILVLYKKICHRSKSNFMY